RLSNYGSVNGFRAPIIKYTGSRTASAQFITWSEIRLFQPCGGPQPLNPLENSSNVVLILFQTGDTTLPASVAYRTEDGGAIAGRDYIAQTGTINFAPKQVCAELSIPLLDNDIADGTRNFLVTLHTPGAGYVVPPNTATTKVLVFDDDYGI